jgi:hypothetical protein
VSYFLIRWEGGTYANDELFTDAVAGGERSFTKMLSGRDVVGKKLLDQILYPLTCEQESKCREYQPVEQDFDAAYRGLNVISKDIVKRVKAHMEAGYPNSTVITIAEYPALTTYKYRHATFFKVLDYKAQRKYKMLPKMAAVKIFGRLYVALNAVNVRVEAPIIVTVGGR